jgi:hypothetical protein
VRPSYTVILILLAIVTPFLLAYAMVVNTHEVEPEVECIDGVLLLDVGEGVLAVPDVQLCGVGLDYRVIPQSERLELPRE